MQPYAAATKTCKSGYFWCCENECNEFASLGYKYIYLEHCDESSSLQVHLSLWRNNGSERHKALDVTESSFYNAFVFSNPHTSIWYEMWSNITQNAWQEILRYSKSIARKQNWVLKKEWTFRIRRKTRLFTLDNILRPSRLRCIRSEGVRIIFSNINAALKALNSPFITPFVQILL